MARFFEPRPQFADHNGTPISGGSVEFFESGTSVPLATYSDRALTTPNANPLTLNSEGRPSVDIWLQGEDYKAVVKDASGVTVYTIDPYDGTISNEYVRVGSGSSRTLAERFAAIVHLDDYLTAEQAADAHGYTGSVDVSAALTAAATAATAGGKNGAVIVSAGKYYLANEAPLGKASLIGAGMDATIFTADGATGGGFSGGAVISFEGDGLTDLPGLSSAVDAGSNSINFASAPDLGPGDIVLLMEETQVLHITGTTGTWEVGHTVSGSESGATGTILAVENVGGVGYILTVTFEDDTPFVNNYANNTSGAPLPNDIVTSSGGASGTCVWAGGSFNRYRYYYPKGEFALVERVDGTTVYLAGGLYDSYNDWATLAKMDVTRSVAQDFTVIGRGGSFGTVPIRWRYGKGGGALRVRARNASYTAMQIRQCFGMVFSNLDLAQDVYTGAASYGFSIANCQTIRIKDSVICAERHGIAHGGFGMPQNLPNRDCITESCYIAAFEQGQQYAFDIHGNAEYCALVDSTVIGGCNIGGNNHMISGVRVFADKASHVDYCLHFVELVGPNISVSDVYCRLTGVEDTSSALITVVTPTWMVHDGTFSLNNVELHSTHTADADSNLIQVRYPSVDWYTPKFSVDLNAVRQRHAEYSNRYLLEIINTGNAPFELVQLTGCHAHNCGLVDTDATRRLIVDGGYSNGARWRGIAAVLDATAELVKIDGPVIEAPGLQGVYVLGANANRISNVNITNLTVVDALQSGAQANAQLEGSVYVQYADRVFVDGCSFRSTASDYETSVGGSAITQLVWGTNSDGGVKQDFTSLGAFNRIAAEVPAILPGDASITATGQYLLYIYAIPITATRTVTLPTTGLRNGMTIRVVRMAGATGAFDVEIHNGSSVFKTLSAAGQWAEVTYYGLNWVVTAQGTL